MSPTNKAASDYVAGLKAQAKAVGEVARRQARLGALTPEVFLALDVVRFAEQLFEALEAGAQVTLKEVPGCREKLLDVEGAGARWGGYLSAPAAEVAQELTALYG